MVQDGNMVWMFGQRMIKFHCVKTLVAYAAKY